MVTSARIGGWGRRITRMNMLITPNCCDRACCCFFVVVVPSRPYSRRKLIRIDGEDHIYQTVFSVHGGTNAIAPHCTAYNHYDTIWTQTHCFLSLCSAHWKKRAHRYSPVCRRLLIHEQSTIIVVINMRGTSTTAIPIKSPIIILFFLCLIHAMPSIECSRVHLARINQIATTRNHCSPSIESCARIFFSFCTQNSIHVVCSMLRNGNVFFIFYSVSIPIFHFNEKFRVEYSS